MLATPGKKLRLKDFDTAFTANYKSHTHAQAELKRNVQRLAKYQDLLYASRKYALLLIFQAMDAAGKDGTIKHVMSGVNPAGCAVVGFQQPSRHELAHDFLWRCYCALPERGRIGIFNRSYYEEVLIVRVHPELLEREELPDFRRDDGKFWSNRFRSINDLERHLADNGTVILKFFLHVSRQEQRRRLEARLERPEKNWKFSEADLHERLLWNDYTDAYQQMIRHTSTARAPWYIIPADHKWFAHLAVSNIVVNTLKRMNLRYPAVSSEQRERLIAARAMLQQQG